MDLQKIVNAMNDLSKNTRSDYHLTLGRAISALQDMDGSLPVVCSDDGSSPRDAHSYRGYYSDLAFEPSEIPTTVSDFLAECLDTLDADLTGYKGGEFRMDASVPMWVAEYGTSSGRAMIDLQVIDGKCVVVVKKID